MEIYVYCIYSTQIYILYRSVCPRVVQSYTIEDEAVNPLTPREYTVLNGNSVFTIHDLDFRDFFLGMYPWHNRKVADSIPDGVIGIFH
jgi:hypothetical protein